MGSTATSADGFHRHNASYVDGRVVCGYADGSRIAKVQLEPGVIGLRPIDIIDARDSVEVLWIHPGQTDLESIPSRILVHRP